MRIIDRLMETIFLHSEKMTFPGTRYPLKINSRDCFVYQYPLRHWLSFYKDDNRDYVDHINRVVSSLLRYERDVIAGGFARRVLCEEDPREGDIDLYLDSLVNQQGRIGKETGLPNEVWVIAKAAHTGDTQFIAWHQAMCAAYYKYLIHNFAYGNKLVRTHKAFTAHKTVFGQPVQLIHKRATENTDNPSWYIGSAVPRILTEFDFGCVGVAISKNFIYFTRQALENNKDRVLEPTVHPDSDYSKHYHDMVVDPQIDFDTDTVSYSRMKTSMYEDIDPRRIMKYMAYGYKPTATLMSYIMMYVRDMKYTRDGEFFIHSDDYGLHQGTFNRANY